MVGKNAKKRLVALFHGYTFWQIFSTSALVALISIVIITSLSLFQYEKELLKQKEYEHELLSQRISKELGMFFGQNITQMVLTGENISVLKLNPEDITLALNELALQVPSFESLSYFDMHGREIATSDSREPGASLAWPEALSHAKRSEQWLSKVMFNSRGIPFIIASIPINSLGQPAGFIVAQISLKNLWYWIDELNGLGDTRLSVLDSEKGIVVADQERRGIQEEYWHWKDRGAVSSLYKDKKYISFHPVEGAPLVIATESTLATFIAQVYQMRYRILFNGAVIMLVALLFALYRAFKISAPVDHLINEIEIYSLDRKRRINEKLPGEYSAIAHAFNRMAESIESQEEQLVEKERLAAVGRLLSGMAHELRYGLNTIINLVDEIASNDPHALKMAKQEVRELNEKISDLLEFTKDQKLNLDDVDADEVIWQAIEKVRYRPEAKKSTIRHEGFGGKVRVRVDVRKMSMVLSNLIRNAVESREEGVDIKVFAGRDNGAFYFGVRDNGPGIPKEIIDNIFIPFYTTKTRGFGLGLFLADMVVRAHKGEVRVIASDPSGTEIRITVPESK